MLTKQLAILVAATAGLATLSAQPRSTTVAKDVTVLGFRLHYLEAGRGAPLVPDEFNRLVRDFPIGGTATHQ